MKLAISILVSFGLVIGIYSNDPTESNKINDMIEVKEIADKNKINISSWKVYQRKELDTVNNFTDMKKKTNEIMITYKNYDWELTDEEKNHHYVWNGKKNTNTSGLTEELKLTSYAKGGKYEIGMSYEVRGATLNNSHLDWIEKTFKEDENVFYTISGKLSEIDIISVSEKILADSQGEVVEQLTEPSFVSISAFSKAFESELITKDNQKINMQIGLRVDDNPNQIDVTLGTPIITSEY
ncbi:YwmB family TATA-box binding protein [Ferdinandcohnia quinoae]|uniref:YwmB family TATA-box binding protein n=1 Tax=Fredinandcohnia quinoae TaxID=2918902 RepID=A0AAW5EAR3_9BACI|nr:YwmB family TATA-box binding protein [Fredinandcohnia sp. SECRCQ15]MCH1626516.1 YwmB family TATA-box binding protein [Fredinandcohnia sp. SECRCQ15]